MGYQPTSSSDFKKSVRVASKSNVTISSPGSSIDGVSLSSGNRVLLTGQTVGSQNGIYYWNGAASTMTRVRDGDQAGEITSGMMVYVSEGDANKKTLWVLTTNDPIVLDTTALTFMKMANEESTEQRLWFGA